MNVWQHKPHQHVEAFSKPNSRDVSPSGVGKALFKESAGNKDSWALQQKLDSITKELCEDQAKTRREFEVLRHSIEQHEGRLQKLESILNDNGIDALRIVADSGTFTEQAGSTVQPQGESVQITELKEAMVMFKEQLVKEQRKKEQIWQEEIWQLKDRLSILEESNSRPGAAVSGVGAAAAGVGAEALEVRGDKTASSLSLSNAKAGHESICGTFRAIFTVHKSKEDTSTAWTNWSVVSGLMTGFAATGLFSGIPTDHLFEFPNFHRVHLMLWCFSTLGYTTATFGFMFLNVGMTTMHTSQEFHQFMQHLGSTEMIPMLLFFVSAVALYLGVCTFFLLACGFHVTIGCIIVCATFCFVPLLILLASLQRSLLGAANGVRRQAQNATKDGEADTIYEELRQYYLVENGGVLSKMSRNPFATRFRKHGEVAEILSRKIYDDWLEKKLQGMVREDPGF